MATDKLLKLSQVGIIKQDSEDSYLGKDEKASAVANDSTIPTGAAVKSFVEGKGYQTSSDVSSAINAALASVLDWKGVVADMDALNALSGMKTGDVYHVTESGSEYAYDGAAWQELGVTFDASGYVKTTDIVYATDDEVRAALGQD